MYFEVNEEDVMFNAVKDEDGVLYIPDSVIEAMQKVAKKLGLTVKNTEGDEDETRFVFFRQLTEDEMEQASSILEETFG